MNDEIFKKIFPFSVPREGQREIIEKIINAFNRGKKHVICNLPCGIGKSVIAVTVMNYFDNGYIITSQKCLQKQYNHDLGIPYILGKNNYTCIMDNSVKCDIGIECFGKCNTHVNCPYKEAVNKGYASKIVAMNYSYFLSKSLLSLTDDKDNIEFMPKRNVITIDECHNLSNSLLAICTFKMDNVFFEKCEIKIKKLLKHCSDEDRLTWLFTEFYNSIDDKIKYFKSVLEKNKRAKKRPSSFVLSKYNTLRRYAVQIKTLEINHKLNVPIIITPSKDVENEYTFKLLYSNNLFKTCVTNYADNFLHMSATVLDKHEYCRDMGIDEESAEYITADSIFPVKNRLIYYMSMGSMSYRQKDKSIKSLENKVYDIMRHYTNKRGIIHTGNYEIAQEIVSRSPADLMNRFILPHGKERLSVIDSFFSSDINDLVLISPSLTEGLDLKDDLTRFSIICKVPYMSLADEWTKIRMNENQKWYLMNAVQMIMQMTGRSIRTETDYCDTYILDSDFEKLIRSVGYMFPKWWQQSVLNVGADYDFKAII